MRRLKVSAEVTGAWIGIVFSIYVYVKDMAGNKPETELDILVMLTIMVYTTIMVSLRFLQMSEMKRIAPVLYWGIISMAGLAMYKLVTWG